MLKPANWKLQLGKSHVAGTIHPGTLVLGNTHMTEQAELGPMEFAIPCHNPSLSQSSSTKSNDKHTGRSVALTIGDDDVENQLSGVEMYA